MMYYAHSLKDKPKDQWQPLKMHLMNTAEKARMFAIPFGCGEVAFVTGLLHDAGKYSEQFQKRLDGISIKADHSTAGALIANRKFNTIGKLIAYCICGHHGGLPDGIDAGFEANRTSLYARLQSEMIPTQTFFDEIDLPGQLRQLQLLPTKQPGYALSFHTKMLFSALVDADYLDTEVFCSPKKAERRKIWPDLQVIAASFYNKMNDLQQSAIDSAVNQCRRTVYNNCLEAASSPKGIFTLTVPTGGGKTLSSMALALKHAAVHGMRRIIYAIPFTSIIEQNARVFRQFLGEDTVLEHHSNYAFEDSEEGPERLAAENWDASIIVTTNVQLFESIFSNKPSQCRKLHNIANSIIILDETQTLPDGLLKPCLAALQCLCRDYGSTVVLCTATQPAWNNLWPDSDVPREIIKEPQQLYLAMRKVQVQSIGTLDDPTLACKIMSHDQVLCIVK